MSRPSGSLPPPEPALPPRRASAPAAAPAAKKRSEGSQSEKPAKGQGLTWRGCWGCWSDDSSVYVLATQVGKIQLVVPGRDSAEQVLYEAALQDVRRQLQDELPDSAVLAAVHWAEEICHPRIAYVAIVGGPSVCKKLQQAWQKRALCSGLVTATWISLRDTSSKQHVHEIEEKVARDLQDPKTRQKTVALELPLHWFAGQSLKQVTQLAAGSPWFEFATLFGEVATAELVCPRDLGLSQTLQLLICYKEPEGAGALRESLTGRYLIYLKSSKVDDCHPVRVTLGEGYTLREQFCAGSGPRNLTFQKQEPTSTSGPASAFMLRRCGQTPVPEILRPPPEIIVASAQQRKFILGREETAEVVFRHPHVSKVHATLTLQESPEVGDGHMLLIQDSSSNGTYVNGTRMTSGRFQQLQPGDRVSFLAPIASLEQDPATYEVYALQSCPATAAAPSPAEVAAPPPPAPQARWIQAKVEKGSEPAPVPEKPSRPVFSAPKVPEPAEHPAARPSAAASTGSTKERRKTSTKAVVAKEPIDRKARPAAEKPTTAKLSKVPAAAKTAPRPPAQPPADMALQEAQREEEEEEEDDPEAIAAGYAALAAAAAEQDDDDEDQEEPELPLAAEEEMPQHSESSSVQDEQQRHRTLEVLEQILRQPRPQQSSQPPPEPTWKGEPAEVSSKFRSTEPGFGATFTKNTKVAVPSKPPSLPSTQGLDAAVEPQHGEPLLKRQKFADAEQEPDITIGEAMTTTLTKASMQAPPRRAVPLPSVAPFAGPDESDAGVEAPVSVPAAPWRSGSTPLPPPPKQPPLKNRPQWRSVFAPAGPSSAPAQSEGAQPKTRPIGAPSTVPPSTALALRVPPQQSGPTAPLSSLYEGFGSNAQSYPTFRTDASTVFTRGNTTDSIAQWVRSWGLHQYEAKLVEEYDDVDQICSIYHDNIQELYSDCNVTNQEDQRKFAAAIFARSRSAA